MNATKAASIASHKSTVSHDAIIDWLAHAREAVLSSPDAILFDLDGVDAFEASTSELYVTVLAAARRGSQQPRSRAAKKLDSLKEWVHRLKRHLLDWTSRRQEVRPFSPEFLFWPRDITHVTTLVPVAQALAAQSRRCEFLACQPTIARQLQDRGIQPVYGPHAWPAAVQRARRDGGRQARALARSTRWQFPDFCGKSADVLEPALRATMLRMVPAAAEATANARESLQLLKPRVLVVGNDLTVEGHVGCQVARQLRIPTAVFMHGTISGVPLQSRHPADRIFVYGDIHRHELLDRGVSDARIVVCGDPGQDGRPRQSQKIHPQLKARLGLREGQPWILVATSGPGHRVSLGHHEIMIAKLADLARAIPGVPIVIKLHRKDRLDHYQAILRTCAELPLHVLPAGAAGLPPDITDWLQGCTMVLTGGSMTAIEAMVMDVPVVTMDFCGELDGVDFIDAGATVHATDAGELSAAVQDLLSARRLPDDVQARVDDFLKGTFFALDGRSSQRAASSLRELAAGEP